MERHTTSQALSIDSIADLTTFLKLKRGRVNSALTLERMRRVFSAILVLSDALMMGLGFWLAYYIRFSSGFFLFQAEVIPSLAFYAAVVLALIPLHLIIYAIFSLYNHNHLLGGIREYTRAFHASTAALLVVIFIAFVFEDFIIARGWLLLAWLLNFFLVIGARFLLRRPVYALRRRGYFLTPALIIGGNGEARLLAHQLSTWATSGLNLLGFVSEELPLGQRVIRNLYALGSLDELSALVERYGVGELIVASSALSRENILDIYQRYGFSDKMKIRFSSGLFEIVTTGLRVDVLAHTPLIAVNPVRLTGVERGFKLAMDYILTSVGLFFLAPFFLLLAILIRLDSPGSAFFPRRVVGVNGREFNAFKFRTMHINGDEILAQHPELQQELAQTHKLKDDPRITRAGKFLRKFSLDELPQLLNVLRGQMSLVGPRMISPPELADYGQWEMNLLTVKPGLTGMWQISGRSDLSYEERVRLDMYYIRNANIWLDLYILWRTVPAVLKGRGAY